MDTASGFNSVEKNWFNILYINYKTKKYKNILSVHGSDFKALWNLNIHLELRIKWQTFCIRYLSHCVSTLKT